MEQCLVNPYAATRGPSYFASFPGDSRSDVAPRLPIEDAGPSRRIQPRNHIHIDIPITIGTARPLPEQSLLQDLYEFFQQGYFELRPARFSDSYSLRQAVPPTNLASRAFIDRNDCRCPPHNHFEI